VRPRRDDVLGGRYRLTELIAIGGMGEVWRATDDVLARDVAVKILKEEYTGDPGFLERFRGEARHTAALAHPNIAITYDYGEAARSAYLVMELVPGQPLSDILAGEGPMEPRRAAGLLAQAARGLSAAHAVGVVHRDIKPGNLLVTPDGRVKVTDFGIARAADAAPLTATGQVMGTAQYLAPEQAMGQPSTPASDVYALGVVGYELLTGDRPFGGDSQVAVAMAHVTADPPTLPVHLPTGVRALIERSMAKDPRQRPADGAVFARAAEAAANGDDAGVLAVLAAAGLAGAAAGSAATGATGRLDAATQMLPPAATRAVPAPGVPAAGAPAARTAGIPTTPPPRRRRMTGPLVALVALVAFLVLGALLAGEAFGPREGAVTTVPVATDPATVPTQAPTTQPRPTSRTATSTPTATSRTTATESATTAPPEQIEISAADYVGRPQGQVRSALRRLGLDVQVDSRSDADAEPDTVVDVSEGTFQEGDTVTITVAVPPDPTTNTDNDGND
jgi:eukaryotic-like serine/threonine-protein kinase